MVYSGVVSWLSKSFYPRKWRNPHWTQRSAKVLAVKEEIQNNNDVHLLLFIIEVVNMAENMNFSENYVEESKNHSSCVDYTIYINSS